MLEGKIKKREELKVIISRLKEKGKKIVFTNGCFDLLHFGHVKYLQDAKKIGDVLIVAINNDSSVKKIKGDKRPLINETDRARTIAALESVDYVTLFGEETPLKTIKLIKPDVLVKGSDWKEENIVGNKFVLGYGGEVRRIKLVARRSTTGLINKIAQLF